MLCVSWFLPCPFPIQNLQRIGETDPQAVMRLFSRRFKPLCESFFSIQTTLIKQPRERTPELKYCEHEAQPRGAARPGTALREPMYMVTCVLSWIRVRDVQGVRYARVRGGLGHAGDIELFRRPVARPIIGSRGPHARRCVVRYSMMTVVMVPFGICLFWLMPGSPGLLLSRS